MKEFPKSFQESIILQSLQPSGPSLRKLAKDNGIPVTTVYGWKKKYAKPKVMKNEKPWTPKKKLVVMKEFYSMPVDDRGSYLRENGLHSSDLEDWENDFCSSVKGPGRPRKDPEVVKLRQSEKELKRDLRRKEKALAEMSARIVLLKKSHEIWGVSEDDE